MTFKIWKKKKKRRNRMWFAWRPVIVVTAKDNDSNRYIVWLQRVFRAKTMDIVSYHMWIS